MLGLYYLMHSDAKIQTVYRPPSKNPNCVMFTINLFARWRMSLTSSGHRLCTVTVLSPMIRAFDDKQSYVLSPALRMTSAYLEPRLYFIVTRLIHNLNHCHQDLGTGGVRHGIIPHLEGGHTTRSAIPITVFLLTGPYVLLSTDDFGSS